MPLPSGHDADGQPKRDDRDRVVCRIRKHDIEEFRAVVDKFGAWTQDLAATAQAAINDAKRPLLAAAENTAAANGDGQAAAVSGVPGDPDTDLTWHGHSLSAAAFKGNHQDALEAAGIRTLGELQEKMNRHGAFWSKELKINGRFRDPIEDCFNRYLTGLQKAARKAAKEAAAAS